MPSHRYAKALQLTNRGYRGFVEKLFLLLWKDDVGSGDITSSIGFSKDEKGEAVVIAKQSGVVAGLEEVLFFIKKKTKIVAKTQVKDGQRVKKGDRLIALNGSYTEILGIERLVLNVIGRLSGIATQTLELSKLAPSVLLVPTRKTLWGPLDKKACLLGGGGTHRIRLDDAVLIKHTHLNASDKSWHQYLSNAFKKKSRFVEIEVGTPKLAYEIAQEFQRPFCMMLDNMSAARARSTITQIKKLNGQITIEVSGGITKKNLRAYAKTGADILSMGALTYAGGFLDVALRVLPTK